MPGLRVDFRETQGLFSKYARANRYAQISAVGSRSGGSARRGTRLLIRRVDLRSNGQEWLGARAAVEGRQRRVPAVGTRRSRPNSAIRGSIQLGLGSGSFSVAWVNHLGPWFGVRVSGAGCAAPGAALRRRLAGERVLRGLQGLQHT